MRIGEHKAQLLRIGEHRAQLLRIGEYKAQLLWTAGHKVQRSIREEMIMCLPKKCMKMKKCMRI